jgi:hypothetical protein
VRALAGIVLALALVLASPASAATVARTVPEAGPVLAGPEVLWGSLGSDGSVRVMAGAPGRPPRLVHRVAAASGANTLRSIGPLAASPEAFAVRVVTSTVFGLGSDETGVLSDDALFAGPPARQPSLVYGSVPERVEFRDCETLESLAGYDVDGARVAIGLRSGPCEVTDPSEPWRETIAVHEGGTRRVVEVGAGHSRFDVRLAGRFLAWTPGKGVVVHDLVAGATVARIRARDIGARYIEDFELGADGTVVFTAGSSRFRRGSRLAARVPGTPGIRLLDRHAGRDLAFAGGRVFYERVLDELQLRTKLVLRPLAGGPARTVARFGRRREATELDFDGSRATWHVMRGNPLTGRIVLREL